MSQVAVIACAEGVAVAAESMLSYGESRSRGLIQKLFPIGPRMVFAAVGNASMPDPRIDDRWPGLGAHLEILTGGKPVEGDPLDVAERIGVFITDVLRYMAERPRGYEGLAIATWSVRYLVAGYERDRDAGVASVWDASPVEAVESGRVTTEAAGKLALGVLDRWPRKQRRQSAVDPGAGPPPSQTLERAEREAAALVHYACRRYPGACGPPLQSGRIPARGPFAWTQRPEWIA